MTVDLLRTEGFAANTVRKIGKKAMNLEVAVDAADMVDQLVKRFGTGSRAAAVELAVRFTTRAIVRAEAVAKRRQREAACATRSS